MNLLIYDLEILKGIPSKDDLDPQYSYCKGWDDFDNMGISVIGAWCSGFAGFGEGYHSFINHDSSIPGSFPEFQELANAADAIAGFNSQAFDDQACAANGIQISTTYDLLREVYVAAGLNPWPNAFDDRYKGYGLGKLATANLGYGKSSRGDKAPLQWQRGDRQGVIDYCLLDVRITKELLDRRERLISPADGSELCLRPDLRSSSVWGVSIVEV